MDPIYVTYNDSKHNKYNSRNTDLLMAMAQYPLVLPSGHRNEYATKLGLSKFFLDPNTNENVRAHFWPSVLGIIPLIAYNPNNISESARAEIPHAVMTATGRLPLRIVALDFIVGGQSGQNKMYFLPGSFENATHGLLSNKTIKNYKPLFGTANNKQFIDDTPGARGANGALYWTDAYAKGYIDRNTLEDKLDKVYKYQVKNRTDSMFDKAWNSNNDSYANTLKNIGVVDGGDVKRIVSPFVNNITDFIDRSSAIASGVGALVDSKGNKWERVKSAGKKYADAFPNLIKLPDELLGSGVSLVNVGQHALGKLGAVQDAKKAAKKYVKTATESVNKHAPNVTKIAKTKVAPTVKKGTRFIWNSIPNGSVKDALRDSPILKNIASGAKYLGLF